MNYNNYDAEDFACEESFVRYFLRESNDDIIFWENWINEHTEKHIEIEAAKSMLNMLTVSLPQTEFEEELKKMKDHINGTHDAKTITMHVAPDKQHSANWKRWPLLRIAAVLLLSISATAIIFISTNDSSQESIEISNNDLIVKSNSNGQKSQLQLSDGSIINLNSNSEVQFLENFSENHREITLRGEAFFEVAHDTQRPFIVKTEDLTIKALGTSFNVKAYGETETLQVALVTGKVEIDVGENNPTGKSILTPGEGLIFDKKHNRVTKEKFDPEFTMAWRNGIIYFKNASWKDVKTTLERWYNVRLNIINEPQRESPYTGQFDNQSLELVLESLSFSKDFRFAIKGKDVEINFYP